MSQVHFASDQDPAMQRAKENARDTFQFFWREMSWEARRIIPGLDLACVKVPFADPPELNHAPDDAAVEEMWIDEVDFDGQVVTGKLLNSPNWLKSVSEGDQAKVPLNEISDWMYAIQGRVYGAFTVNVLRAHMGRSERRQHDEAWGTDFGDPAAVQVVPADWFGKKSGGLLKRLFGGGDPPTLEELDEMEHPMAMNMTESFEEFLTNDPSNVHSKDERGFTFLHQQALAGTAIGVSILLKHGADPNVLTNHGMTPLALSRSLGWKQVSDVLLAHGGR